MARIRTIKPEFAHSESMGRVSREARLLFILLWTFVDDSGKARGHSRMLASALFPYDEDAPGLIDGWVSELEAEGCVRRYEINGASYIIIPKWLNHQRIDKPTASRLPDPREFPASPRENPLPLPSTLDLGRGKGDGEEEEAREDAPLARPIGRIAWTQEVPDQWHVTAAGQLKSLGLEPIETNTLAAKFTAHYRATGETRTVSEWQARFIKWAIDEARKPNGSAQRQPGKPERKSASSIFLELGNGTRAAE